MGWMLLGFALTGLWFVGWALCAVGGDADDRAVAEYERQRAAFEDLFE